MSEPNTQDELARLRQWLDEQLNTQFKRHNDWRQRDKVKSFALHIATAVLSAVVTVLIGLQVSDWARPVLSNVALGVGAVVTVLAGTETYFNHRDLWILRVQTLVRIEELKRQFDYHSLKSVLTVDELDRYAEQLDQILKRDHSAWIQMRTVNHSEHAPPAPAEN
ncbi:DUF4231 domain-containing protein [Nocardia mexicana]|uniref:Uncharacterized protein DUF4231 n=1 Tax=Nocardia mexicana TaxID=279262 RepID=A0A370HB19_9NOCA|nr:DUF4231 domain-containing protein [Nocardia mexicana]RDI53990.1 uncharacterized protein DUF4231 [Nocardia mexicana]